jgi:ribosomal protein S18 acetylase RimI-like enzyme
MTTLPQVSTITEDQRDGIMSLMTAAFITDPMMRWLFPDPAAYLRAFPAFANAFGGRAIEHGSGFLVDGHRGAALWFPPGVSGDDDALAAIVAESGDPAALADIEGFMEQMIAYHPHDEDCWYLPMIGVDPASQGRGCGAVLMKHALKKVDEVGGLAYLESSNPRNVSLYERHGFEPIGTIQSGHSPPMTPMLRPRRG